MLIGVIAAAVTFDLLVYVVERGKRHGGVNLALLCVDAEAINRAIRP